MTTSSAQDPNALYGPAGYGPSNFVTVIGNTFAYKVTFENDPSATAPAQTVTLTDNLDGNLDWSTFQVTGFGFGDNNFTAPPNSQYFSKTISMNYNGQTFNVLIEAGIHSDTGQVYAAFYSLDPATGLPPANVLTGFLPPEDGTGRGMGYLTYTVSPKATTPTDTVIPNVASISFDAGQPIATNQASDTDPSLGTDPAKDASVTADANVPTAQVTALPAYVGPSFGLSWSGSDGSGGSGIASYTVYVSSDGGNSYTPWLVNTSQTSGTYTGATAGDYSFYVVATSNVGNVQSANTQTAAVSTQSLSALDYWRWENFAIPTNSGIAADTANPVGDGIANLLKYGLDLPPLLNAGGAPFVTGSETDSNGTHLTLTFNRIADPALTYTVEASNDLNTWQPIWSSTGSANVAGVITVTDTAVSLGPGALRFLRLEVGY